VWGFCLNRKRAFHAFHAFHRKTKKPAQWRVKSFNYNRLLGYSKADAGTAFLATYEHRVFCCLESARLEA
jgi:hypothetical protein